MCRSPTSFLNEGTPFKWPNGTIDGVEDVKVYPPVVSSWPKCSSNPNSRSWYYRNSTSCNLPFESVESFEDVLPTAPPPPPKKKDDFPSSLWVSLLFGRIWPFPSAAVCFVEVSHPLARWIRSSWVWYLKGFSMMQGGGWLVQNLLGNLGIFCFVCGGGWLVGWMGLCTLIFFWGLARCWGTCFWFNDCVFDSFKYQWNSGGSSVEDKIVFFSKKTPDELTRLWLLKSFSTFLSHPLPGCSQEMLAFWAWVQPPKPATQAPHTRHLVRVEVEKWEYQLVQDFFHQQYDITMSQQPPLGVKSQFWWMIFGVLRRNVHSIVFFWRIPQC